MTKKSKVKNDIVSIRCYNSVEKMRRKEAIKFYHEGMMCCEGSEQDRYTTIYFQLLEGRKFCSDRV